MTGLIDARLIVLALLALAYVSAPAGAQTAKRNNLPIGVFITNECRAQANSEALRKRCQGRPARARTEQGKEPQPPRVILTPKRDFQAPAAADR